MKHHKSHKPHFEPHQSGDLFVTGQGKVEIRLLDRHRPPEEIFVFLKEHHHHHHVPCNPHTLEEVECELHFKEHHYVLVIKWHVTDVREIVWAVRY